MSENLVALLEQSRQQFPSSPLFGVRQAEHWRWITYGQFDQRVEQSAARLAKLGVGCGDRVAIVGDWCVEWVELAHAACRRRASFVLLPERLGLDDWLCIFRDCGAKLAFTARRVHYDALTTSAFESAGLRRVFGLALPADHPDSYLRWVAEQPGVAESEAAPRPDDIASRLYARSDSGRPRAIGVSHRTLCRASHSIGQPSYSVRRTLCSILSLRGAFSAQSQALV
jgi:long-subunit acyl-CoA synthetase (AMP-forming)